MARVVHFHDEVTPPYFYKLLLAHWLCVLSHPPCFMQYLGGMTTMSITLKTTTSCTWMIKLKDVNNKVVMDEGWSDRICSCSSAQEMLFVTFKLVDPNIFHVVIFDYFCFEVLSNTQHTLEPLHISYMSLCLNC
jgi:hypothetical protein